MTDFTMPKPAAFQWFDTAQIRKNIPANSNGPDWRLLYTAEALRDVLEQIANQLEFTGLTGNDIRAMKDAIK